jgi:RHS repeat-associated protein
VQNGGKDTLYYVHTDYQGSLTALSLPNGTVVEKYAYDPWGNRRNPTNWTQTDTRTAFILNRGYTMHEHLPEFNLINMNGRVYDPLTAMFFSPDPYLQAPGNWLNYNRYGYCFNNPFMYTDPDGEWIWIVVAAVVGGVINVATHWDQIDGDWGKGLAAFGVGAAGGALAAVTGGAAFAAYGGAAAGAGGFIAGSISSGVGYAFGSTATSIGNASYFGDPMPTLGQFATGLGFSMLSGGAINGSISAINGNNFWSGNPVAQGRGVFSLNNTAKPTVPKSIPKISGPTMPQPEINPENITNARGVPYPKVTVEGYGEVPFPEGPYTPNNSQILRSQFTPALKAEFKEWWIQQSRPWPTAPKGSEIWIHHIQPLKYGGINSFENLVPLIQPQQHPPFTSWWTGFRIYF